MSNDSCIVRVITWEPESSCDIHHPMLMVKRYEEREKLNSSFRQHVNAIGRWCSGNSPFFNVIIRRTKTDGFHVSSNPQWWCNFAPFAFLSSTHTIRHRRLSISDSFILKRSSERKKSSLSFLSLVMKNFPLSSPRFLFLFGLSPSWAGLDLMGELWFIDFFYILRGIYRD